MRSAPFPVVLPTSRLFPTPLMNEWEQVFLGLLLGLISTCSFSFYAPLPSDLKLVITFVPETLLPLALTSSLSSSLYF